jgi:hypothetical protein
MSADLVIINGKVITVDKGFSIAQATAVKGERIIAVGTNEQVKALAGKRTKMLDLKGKCLLPGINDAHIHAALYWGSRPPVVLDAGYPAVKSIRDIVNAVSKQVQEIKPGEWVRGTGLNLANLKECKNNPARYPTRWDLDLVSPLNPVYLGVIPFSLGEHVTLLNTRALDIVGITRDTAIPPGCEIVKDPADGEPTGLLKGGLLDELSSRNIPPFTREQKRKAILTAMKELNSLGITSITEGALGPGGAGFQGGLWDTECIDIYRELAEEGKLTLRVGIMMLLTLYGSYSQEALYGGVSGLSKNPGFGNSRLKMAGVKLFADGIPLNRTAWMYEEYVGGGKGYFLFTGDTDEERCDELKKFVAYSHQNGIRVGIHVTGDRAIDACIDSFVKAEQAAPKGLRHYLIHGDFVSSEGAKKMARYGIGVSIQPALVNIVNNFLPYCVGKERSLNYGCLKTLLDAGVQVAGGSDAPVTYPDWKIAVQSIVTRDYLSAGGSAGHVTVPEALRIFTLGGAWQDRQENDKGSITVGKLADFCILDGDILNVEPQKIKDLRTVVTIVGGEIVYDAGD